MTATRSQGMLVGDGRNARNAARSRLARFSWLITVVSATITVLLFLVLTDAPSSSTPLSIANPQEEGARAVAEVLRQQGVSVTEVSALASVPDAAQGDGTLVVATYMYFEQAQLESILAWDGPVIWLAPAEYDLEAIDGVLQSLATGGQGPITPACNNTDALRARSLVAPGERIRTNTVTSRIETCFGSRTSGYVAAILERENKSPMTVVAAPSFLTNEFLDAAGNASFALSILGSKSHLAWYSGSAFDTSVIGGSSDVNNSVTAPPWVDTAMLALVLTIAVAALWRGRRFGPLIHEPLPVIVHASEATLGRARLYRRGRALGHAAAALRAGAASRLATRLGLGIAAGRAEIVAGVASASGKDPATIDALLYGSPPRSEAALIDLVQHLDALEREVDPT